MTGNLSVDGGSQSVPNYSNANITINGEKATKKEYINSVLAFTQKAGAVVSPQQCVTGKLPDGARFAVCKNGTYVGRQKDGAVEITLIQGNNVSYVSANKQELKSGCTDQDGNKCE